MKKPVIGVLPLVDQERDSYWMLPGYFRGLEAAGAIPIMLPLHGAADGERLLELCDGLLFTGGQDVDPQCYGQMPSERCGPLSPERDHLELRLLRMALSERLPILGICRGLQLINVAYGGTLYQDLQSQLPGSLKHRMDRPYDRTAHLVRLSGPLKALYGTPDLGVNSCHHQGIRDLAPGLAAMARAEDRLVEAVWDPARPFLWAVQWHPEFYDPAAGPGAPIFKAFVQAAQT